MAEYYLISQLPSLDGISESTPLPITEERFLDLCGRFLGKNAQRELSNLTLLPSRDYEKSTVSLINAWNEGEQSLRLALAKVRADKLKKTFGMDISLSGGLLQAARTAVDFESPMEAELFLTRSMTFVKTGVGVWMRTLRRVASCDPKVAHWNGRVCISRQIH